MPPLIKSIVNKGRSENQTGGTASSCINLILRGIIWLLRKENDTAVLTLSVDAKLK